MKRVSFFSAWEKPKHTIVSEEEVDDLIEEGHNEQKGVVISLPDYPEPTEWHGPGVEDLTS